MYTIIAGGGKVGANVARTLLRLGHEVTLIEQSRDYAADICIRLGLELGEMAPAPVRPAGPEDHGPLFDTLTPGPDDEEDSGVNDALPEAAE